VTLLQAKN